MIEKIKEEFELLKDGIKVVTKFVINLIFYVICFVFFVAIMSYIWEKNTTEIQRQHNESIEELVTLAIPLILTGFVIRYVKSKLKDD